MSSGEIKQNYNRMGCDTGYTDVSEEHAAYISLNIFRGYNFLFRTEVVKINKTLFYMEYNFSVSPTEGML